MPSEKKYFLNFLRKNDPTNQEDNNRFIHLGMRRQKRPIGLMIIMCFMMVIGSLVSAFDGPACQHVSQSTQTHLTHHHEAADSSLQLRQHDHVSSDQTCLCAQNCNCGHGVCSSHAGNLNAQQTSPLHHIRLSYFQTNIDFYQFSLSQWQTAPPDRPPTFITVLLG